jgi:hypothetical protein
MESHALPKVELTAKRWNAALARKMLDEYSASGMSLTAFARTCGVNLQRLSWWRKRLTKARRPQTVTFIPAAVSRVFPGITLRLPGGVAIEVADTTALPARWVAELARSLASTS